MLTQEKLKPDWAGEDILSRFVNILINNKSIYKVMKYQARQVLITTAEKNGIPWRKNREELEKSSAKQAFELINDPNLVYPDYYQVPFHAYDRGNLCWEAAFEAISATQAMYLRIWRNEPITWSEAETRLRGSFYQVLAQYSPKVVNDILDLGCSVGISTLSVHRYFSEQQNHPIRTIGLDLSPYMLAVAQVSDRDREISQWMHRLAENTGLPDNSIDVITLQLVIHELPRHATQKIFQEALRILRPGGALAIIDNDPSSPVIQNLPPALFILMKSTEPWSDDYYTFNVEEALQATGFDYKATVATDPRHRTIIGIKP